jgi:hypothetical protein
MQMRARTILIGGKAVDRGNDGKDPVRCDRCEIVVATSGGVVPHVDVMSLRPSMAGSEEIALEQERILRSADRNLYTGQNPASAAPVAQQILDVLN